MASDFRVYTGKQGLFDSTLEEARTQLGRIVIRVIPERTSYRLVY